MKTTTRPTSAPALALPERSHVHDQVAAERGMDPQQLLADLADAIRRPFLAPERAA